MLAFPQLSTGAMAQLPIERTTRYRARRNAHTGGDLIELGDPDFEEREWTLALRELTDAELQALEDLFVASRGRAGTFTFLAPGANLLRWSESLTVAPWSLAGALVESQPDPLGADRATHLLASGQVSQSMAAPSEYRYSATAWLRSAGAGASMQLSDGGATAFSVSVPGSSQWRRFVVRYTSASSTDTVAFTLTSGPSSPLEVFGPQVEPQSAPSAYKMSTDRGGVFPNTRFDQDSLTDVATGPGRHDTRVRLVWTPSQS